MERYESLGPVGEGSYGTVLKCRHRDSGRLVAIKKFVDSDDDKAVKKIALREIRLLRQLRHGNLVNLLEVWKRRRRWYLVFEFVERTLLHDLEQNPGGLDLNTSRQYLYQILRAAAFCHQKSIIHRDIKPENILISQGGVVKLCDFGFARTVASPAEGGVYTDYVATRWYRAPELLVGDIKYGKPVDVWAVGCLLLEMLTGQPLFPGDSDLDQIYHIVRCLGNLTAPHQELFHRNPVFTGVRLPECYGQVPLQQRFPTVTSTALDLAQSCLQMDPERRAQCLELLEHPLFTKDSFHIRFLNELTAKIQRDHRENSALPKTTKTPRREKDQGNEKNQRSKDRKQMEDVDEKVNKEKEKKDKKEEEKMEKTKGKQPSKLSKTIRNTSEPLLSTKKSKALGAKVINNTARASVAMKSRPGKATGAQLKREHEISKSAKTLTSDSSEGTKTVTGLKDNNRVAAKPKHKNVASPETRDDHLKSTKKTKDIDSSGLHCSCSDTAVASETEKNVMDICKSSESTAIQKYGKKWSNANTKVPKLSKSSTPDHPNGSLSSKVSLISTVNRIDTSLACEACQPSNNDHIEVSTPTIPSVTKPCKATTISEHQTDQLTVDPEQRRTSECPKVLASNAKLPKTTSNFGPEMTKTNISLLINQSKTLTSDLSAQSFTVFAEASPKHSTMTLPKGISNPKLSKTGSTSIAKPTNDTTCAPNKPSKGLAKDSELTEVSIETKKQHDSFNTSYKAIKDHGYLKRSPATKTEGSRKQIFHALGKDQLEDPLSSESSSVHQQSTFKSKIIPESRSTSASILSEIPKTNTLVGTTFPKTLKVLDKENRENLALSVSIGATTKSSVNQTSNVYLSSSNKQKNDSSEVESDVKSLKPPHSKSLIGQPQAELGSFSNQSTSATTMTLNAQKTTFPTEARKKSDNSERNDTTNISSIPNSTLIPSMATPDHRASKRSFILHNMDTSDLNEFDFTVPHHSPPPPPPPPSSTPLLLPPSSTTLIPSFSDVKTNSPAVSDHLTLGAGFHPGNHSLRCIDKPRHRGGVYSRLAQQSLSSHITASVPAQVSDKSLICERSFLSDRRNCGNSGGVAVAKKKSDIHFPDLRGSVLAELRGRDGKHSKGVAKDQRKDKQPVPSVSPSEPQQHGRDSMDRHHTHTPRHAS
ncbi:serine/threonine-protein kinase ppk16-like [Xiphias gladius]|uniref:serine/threonine-protein kinase ppk16-like n=1 Tax=Xiphias gladius TaxID=8245 RepID=UPI001A9A0BB2|nr:serine/threonine-protein kinase ppk16-like [Xiphias gladius]